MRLLIVLLFIVAMPYTARAAQPCQNPPGDEGDQVYNITYHVMQYCNGSYWVAMGSVMGQGDNLGEHTAAKTLNMSGFRIENLAPPTGNADAANRQFVMQYVDAAVEGIDLDESDPKVGAVTNNKWCRGTGTQITCDRDAPSALPVCSTGGMMTQYPDGWRCTYPWCNGPSAWTARGIVKNWQDIASSADGSKLVAITYTEVYISTDSGVTWTLSHSAGTGSLMDVFMTSDGLKIRIAYHIGAAGTILASDDGGATWEQRTVSANQGGLQSIASSADGMKLVGVSAGAGSLGGIFRSTDGGVTWTRYAGSQGKNWSNIASSADGTKLIASISTPPGGLATSSDSGATWIDRPDAGTFIGKVAILPDGSAMYYIRSSYANTIMKSTDNGVTWSGIHVGNISLNGITFSNDGSRIAGFADNLYLSSDAGATWTAQGWSAIGLQNAYALAASDDWKKLAMVGYNARIAIACEADPFQ